MKKSHRIRGQKGDDLNLTGNLFNNRWKTKHKYVVSTRVSRGIDTYGRVTVTTGGVRHGDQS